MAYERPRKPCRGCGGPKPPGQGVTYCLDCNASCDEHVRYTNKCVECVRIYNKAAWSKAKDDPDLLRRRNRQRKANRYNISIEQVVAAENAEGCEVCGSIESLVIDHDHSSGQYRGVLCDLCNKALGQARDNPEILRDLASYLENFSYSPVTLEN